MAAYISGATKRPSTVYKDNGTNISDKWLSSLYGRTYSQIYGDPPYNDTGNLGGNIGDYFAAINYNITTATIPNVSDSQNSPGTASTSVSFLSNLNIQTIEGPATTTVDQWAAINAINSDFEVRFVYISGNTANLSGADSVWRGLSSNRSVSLTLNTAGFVSSVVRADWRKVGSGSNYFSSQFTMACSVI
jgi:hypothetical protein